jgi:hypothetical protein
VTCAPEKNLFSFLHRLEVFAAIALALFSGSGRAGVRPTPDPEKNAREWRIPEHPPANLHEFSRIAEDFPNSAMVQRQFLAAAFKVSDRRSALSALSALARIGAGLAETDRKQAALLLGDAFVPFDRRLLANVSPIERSGVRLTIPSTNHLIHSVMWNSRSRQLYAASVVDRRVLRVSQGGQTQVVLDRDLNSPLIGAYDPKRDRMWVVTTVVGATPEPTTGFSGILWFDGKGKEARISSPPDGDFGDVSVAADGTAYIAGGQSGAVYRCKPNCTAVEQVAHRGSFRIAGAVAPVGPRWVYVEDVKFGLAAIDRRSGRIFQVAIDPKTMIDGIDSLLVYGSHSLIALQGTSYPQRIVRLNLSKDGLRVESSSVLERANRAWGGVSPGFIVGNRLIYIGNAQWNKYGRGGKPEADALQDPTMVRSLRIQ